MLNGAICLVQFYFNNTIHSPSDYDQCVVATTLGKPPHHLGTCSPTHLAAWECILSVSSLVWCTKHRPVLIFAALKWSKWSKIKGSGHIIMCLLLINKSNRETFAHNGKPGELSRTKFVDSN